MKRRRFYIFIAVFVVGLLSHINAVAGTNRLLLQDVTMQNGGSAFLSFQLENNDPITGFQCDLYLPTGVSIDNYMILLGRTNTNQHGVTTRKMEDGAIRIVCASATSALFSGNSGEVLSIRVSNTLNSGQYEMSLKNIILTDPDATRYVSENVTGTVTILNSNKLELQDLSILDGNSNQTLPIYLKNETQISGFQCDLYLPEGVEVLKNEDGDYLIELQRTSANEHSVIARQMEDGSLRIVCSSMKGTAFSDNDGEVLGVQIKCNLESGSHLVGLKNIILTNSDAARFTSPDISCNIHVVEPVVISAKSYTREYGEANPVFEYTVEGAELNGEPEIICEATETSPVGEYPIIIKKGSVTNYNDTYVNGVLTITAAPLTIAAGTYTKKQGEAMPEFVPAFEGFKNNETEDVLTMQPVISCEATEISAPGEYDVTVSGAEALNYDINYVNGKLVVTEADPVILTAKSYTREYGEDNPAFEFTSEGMALEGTPEIICEATVTSPVGEYPIIIKKGSVTNYNDSYVNGVLTITKAPLTVSVGNYTKKQYDPMPEFSVTYEGFKNNETKDVLTKQPEVSCEANEDSAPGEYPIAVSGAEAVNYQIQYVAGKLTVTEPDSYTLTYLVDGEIYQSFKIKYRERIVPLEAPTKEGYTFSGWSEIPETMPANDVVVTGAFTINQYTVKFLDWDGTVISETSLDYHSAITAPADPVREGYTFTGWDTEVPSVVPAHDVTFTATYSINSYTLTYMVDGEEYKSFTVVYGTAITPEAEPTKEGYTFSGWSEIPETMPANDVVVTGTFTINQYKLTYIIDGEEYKSFEVDFNAAITPISSPVKKGMTFSGWSEIPETMPAHDVTVTGTYSWLEETIGNVIYQVTDTLNNYASVIGNEEIEGKTRILSSVEIGGYTYTVNRIGKDAFAGCGGLTKVFIPESVTSIDSYAFAGCSGLTDVFCYAENVPETNGTAFNSSPVASATLHVPEGSLDSYKATSPWNEFGNIVAITLEPEAIAEETTVNPAETATPGSTTTDEGVNTSLGSDDEVNVEEGSVTMHTPMTTEEVSQLVKSVEPSSSDFAESFKGIYFQLAAGKGKIELDIETLGNYLMSVMKGSRLIGNYAQNTRGTITIEYDIDLDTWFFAYPAVSTPSGIRRANAADADGALKVYSIRIIPEEIYDPDGIGATLNNKGQMINDIYDLNGRKLAEPQKGINIIRYSDGTSRKVLIK